jgi:ABC-type sugar transport system ATPase subunit
MAEVLVKNLTKQYGAVTAVHDITLEIKDKEFVVLWDLQAAANQPPCA